MTGIDNTELLARFIVSSKWYRADQTIKPEAFLPHPEGKLSVTRHSGITKTELWQIGREVALSRQANLHGRTDLLAGDCRKQGLHVVPDEPPKNHVHVENWPSEKSAQKMIALELAKVSSNLIRQE